MSTIGDTVVVEADTISENEVDPPKGYKAYGTLLGSFLGLTINFGIINSIGSIQTYVSTNQLRDVSPATISWIFSIYLCITYGLTPFAGHYFDQYGPYPPLIIGAVLIFGGLFAAGSATEVWHFILGLSVCVGIGNSLSCPPLIGMVSHWYYKNIGFAIGLSSTGGSIGGICIPLMLRGLYPKLGFMWTMRILAFFTLGVNILSIIFIRQRTDLLRHHADDGKQKDKFAMIGESFTNFKYFKEKKFGTLTWGIFFGELSLMLTLTYYGTYAIAHGMTESESYLLFLAYNACGIAGRWIPGFLADRYGYLDVMSTVIFGCFVSVFTIWLPFGGHRKALYAFISIFGFCSGSILSLAPACVRQISPIREFGSRYGLMYFFVAFSNLFGFPLAAAIIGDGTSANYNKFVAFCGSMMLASFLFWYLCRYVSVGFKLNVKV